MEFGIKNTKICFIFTTASDSNLEFTKDHVGVRSSNLVLLKYYKCPKVFIVIPSSGGLELSRAELSLVAGVRDFKNVENHCTTDTTGEKIPNPLMKILSYVT